METTQNDTTWTQATDHLWLAGSTVYPRITVVGETEAEALDLLQTRREFWLALPESGEAPWPT